MSVVQVRPIRTGTVPLSPAYVFRDRARGLPHVLGLGVARTDMIAAPIGAFLLEHPDRGPILVDTGMHPVCATDPSRSLGRLGAALARGLRVGSEENVPARLRAWGLRADDIGLVVMTHLHADHTSGMPSLPRASFVITREEWRAARRLLSGRDGYIAGHLPAPERVELVSFGDATPYGALERTIDLLGDGSVRLVSTPGHTHGHMSVLVQTATGPVLLLGDAAYTLRNLRDDVLPWRTADDEASRGSMRELRAFAARTPEAILVPTHDEEAWRRLEAAVARPSAPTRHRSPGEPRNAPHVGPFRI